MNSQTQRQKALQRLLGLSKKELDVAEPEVRPVLEQLLYAVLRERTSRARADQAYQNLQTQFYDWNEIRVSALREVEEALNGLSHAENRAFRIITILQEVFESTYSFDLESLHKKGLKQAEKQLQRYQGANEYAVAYCMQQGLGGHSLPLDADMQRTLERLQVLDGAAGETNQATLEHLVPKAQGARFCETVSTIAQEFCFEKSPACSRCPVQDACPTGQANLRRKPAAARAVAARARAK